MVIKFKRVHDSIKGGENCSLFTETIHVIPWNIPHLKDHLIYLAITFALKFLPRDGMTGYQKIPI